MAELVNHNTHMSKSSPVLGHMHAESNTMATGYAGAFQFWKSKEQGKYTKKHHLNSYYKCRDYKA